MKSSNIIRKLDRQGRIAFPKELRQSLKINLFDSIEIFLEEDLIVFQKYTPEKVCLVTGEISDENRDYANGLILSPEGAKILFEELEKRNQSY